MRHSTISLVLFGTSLLACTANAQPLEGPRLAIQMGHRGEIKAAKFSGDGRLIVTGGLDGSVRIWDRTSFREIRSISKGSNLWDVDVSADGRVIAVAYSAVAVAIDAATGEEIDSVGGGMVPGMAAAISPDGNTLVAIYLGQVHIRNIRTKQERPLPPEAAGYFRGLSHHLVFSRDSNRVAVAGSGVLAMIDLRSLRVIPGFLQSGRNSLDPPTSLSFSRNDDSLIIARSGDGVYSWKPGAAPTRLRESRALADRLISASPDSRFFVVEEGQNSILVDASGATYQFSEPIRALAWSPDGRQLLYCPLRSGGGAAVILDLSSKTIMGRLEGSANFQMIAQVLPGNGAILSGSDARAWLWNLKSGRVERSFGEGGYTPALLSFLTAPCFLSRDGLVVGVKGTNERINLLDTLSGAPIASLRGDRLLDLSADHRTALVFHDRNLTSLVDVSRGVEIVRLASAAKDVLDTAGGFLEGDQAVAVQTAGGVVVNDARSGAILRSYQNAEIVRSTARLLILRHNYNGLPAEIEDAVLSRSTGARFTTPLDWLMPANALVMRSAWGLDVSLDRLAIGASDGQAYLWDTRRDALIAGLRGHLDAVTSAAFLNKDVLTASFDGTVKIWNPESGQPRATLIPHRDGGWTVVAPDGRFDASDLDAPSSPAHWVLPDDPFRAKPLELFMRDYYTPRLLARIVAGESLPPIPPINQIRNRVQPEVQIVRFEPSSKGSNRINVLVRASARTEKNQGSGLQDLRLFRDGKMVGYREGSLENGTFAFNDVQVPLASKKVAFTAYAFNSSRIKSATAERDFEYAAQGTPRPRAWLIQIGVNHYRAEGCELRYAANDAHKLRSALETRLKSRGLDVHAIELISDGSAPGATQDEIRDALARVALSAAPDDVFVLSFSGHGYTAPDGQFYIFPSDISGSCVKPDLELLKNAISADQLTLWLRPIDAGEMALILDSCYSAASVESNDFKPGPMDSRGLGQLAYDKRIRILAASQSDQRASEDARLGQGLLSYALTEEGLVQGKADWKPKDGRITLGEWLAYAAEAVPRLSTPKPTDPQRGLITGSLQGQIPALFDFSKQDNFLIQ